MKEEKNLKWEKKWMNTNRSVKLKHIFNAIFFSSEFTLQTMTNVPCITDTGLIKNK